MHNDRLRFTDLKHAMRIVGECRDHGSSPVGWLQHAADGLRPLIDARYVIAGLNPAQGFRLHAETAIIVFTDFESTHKREAFFRYMVDETHLSDPAFLRWQERRRPGLTLRRDQLISDDDFHRAANYVLRTQTFGIEEYLFSEFATASGTATLGFSVHRRAGVSRFSPRETHLVNLFHGELARLVGPVLSDGSKGTSAALPRRLRQTLWCLLEGDSEKQAARRLGLSSNTIHTYVVALYRRFAVSSRAELLSKMHSQTIGTAQTQDAANE
jgi:DNA-binding CsgD family transcriptional regulator